MIETLISALERLVATLRQKYPTPPIVTPINVDPPPPAPLPTSPTSQISNFVLGIEGAEGFPNNAGARYNNPCDLKFTEYTKSLGAVGIGLQNFCIFNDYHSGLQACVQLVTDACNGKLIAYKPTMTINEFCTIFAQPPVLANYVNKAISLCQKVDGLTQIKELL